VDLKVGSRCSGTIFPYVLTFQLFYISGLQTGMIPTGLICPQNIRWRCFRSQTSRWVVIAAASYVLTFQPYIEPIYGLFQFLLVRFAPRKSSLSVVRRAPTKEYDSVVYEICWALSGYSTTDHFSRDGDLEFTPSGFLWLERTVQDGFRCGGHSTEICNSGCSTRSRSLFPFKLGETPIHFHLLHRAAKLKIRTSLDLE